MALEIKMRNTPSWQQYEKTDFVQITKDCLYILNGKKIWIPNGYFYDGASIPWLFWQLVGSPFLPRFMAAALFHDWGYLTHVLSRSVYDGAFCILLQQCGVGKIKANIMWSAVRTGGALAWGNKQTDIEELAKIRTEISQRPDHGEQFILAA